MSLRRKIKHLVREHVPGLVGWFPYFGTKLYFPKRSLAFRAACEQGVFEVENVRVLQAFARPSTWMFDVGANIGLMSAPILQAQLAVRVLAFEPSPNVLPWLAKSIAGSPYKDRWTLVPKAVGDKSGRVRFILSSSENSLFDGLRHTGRVERCGEIEVEMTTIDEEWVRLGEPQVSIIKCDVEGAEMQVLAGAKRCLAAQRPALLMEWNAENLEAFQCPPSALLAFAADAGYRPYAMPALAAVANELELRAQMALTESFLLLPL